MAEQRRNPYRAGSVAYAQARAAKLRQQIALDRANLSRAKTTDTRRRLRRRLQGAHRTLREIDEREEYRANLSGLELASFNAMPIGEQRRQLAVERLYPKGVPSSDPDPFIGPRRDEMWRNYYATREGHRIRALRREAAK
jgi:hypothetical protein